MVADTGRVSLRGLGLGIRFACELAAVAAVVWWGWPWAGIAGGVAVIAVWGTFIGPKARRRLPDPQRLALELVIFASAAVGYWSVGQPVAAVVFAAAAVVTMFPRA